LILGKKGAENIMTVISENGMDEFSTSAKNRICFLRNNKILTNMIDPEVVGLHKSSLKEIQIGTKEQAIKSFVSVLNNTANRAMIETTALNAAAGLIVANVAKNFDEGLELALNTIKNEKAFKLFESFTRECGNPSKLKEVQES
jgi:anthranilate phosphoribosyltransferase